MITWHLKRIRSAVPVHWKAMIQIMYTILTRNRDVNRINYSLVSEEPVCSHHWVEWVGGQCIPARAGISAWWTASGVLQEQVSLLEHTQQPSQQPPLEARQRLPVELPPFPPSCLVLFVFCGCCAEEFPTTAFKIWPACSRISFTLFRDCEWQDDLWIWRMCRSWKKSSENNNRIEIWRYNGFWSKKNYEIWLVIRWAGRALALGIGNAGSL